MYYVSKVITIVLSPTYSSRDNVNIKIVPSINSGAYWGISGVQIDYLECYPTCLECFGGDIDNCESCKPAYTRYDSTLHECFCPYGQYVDVSNSYACTNCGGTIQCRTCNPDDKNECYTCEDNSYYYNYDCLNPCPG